MAEIVCGEGGQMVVTHKDSKPNGEGCGSDAPPAGLLTKTQSNNAPQPVTKHELEDSIGTDEATEAEGTFGRETETSSDVSRSAPLLKDVATDANTAGRADPRSSHCKKVEWKAPQIIHEEEVRRASRLGRVI